MKHFAVATAIVLCAGSAWAEPDPFSEEDSVPSAEEEADSDPLLDGGQTATTKTTPVTESGETALALNPAEALGIGVGFTLPGTPAIMASKYLNAKLGVQAGLAFDFANFSAGPAGMEVDGSIVSAGAVGYGLYRLKATSTVAINALAGLEIAYGSVSFGSGAASVSESGVDFRLSTGLQAELYIFERVSLYAQVGITLAFLGDVSAARRLGTAPDPTRNTSSLVLQVGPEAMVRSVGLTWWL